MRTPLPRVPTMLEATIPAARHRRPQGAHAAPVVSRAPAADPTHLVVRALAILDEETEAWHARRTESPAWDRAGERPVVRVMN